MNFATAKTAVRIGMQIRLLDEYGTFPHHVPAGTTGTVIENRLDRVDPDILIALDDPSLTPWGTLQIRGPEEALPVSVVTELAANALEFDPTDERQRDRDPDDEPETRFPAQALLESDRVKLGRWGDAVPFEVVSPETTSLDTRRAAVARHLKSIEDHILSAKMSDNRYYTSKRFDADEAHRRRIETALDAMT